MMSRFQRPRLLHNIPPAPHNSDPTAGVNKNIPIRTIFCLPQEVVAEQDERHVGVVGAAQVGRRRGVAQRLLLLPGERHRPLQPLVPSLDQAVHNLNNEAFVEKLKLHTE